MLKHLNVEMARCSVGDQPEDGDGGGGGGVDVVEGRGSHRTAAA